MIRKMLSVLLMLSLFSACSIKSSQYSYIKSLLYDKTGPSSPEKNWNLSWAKFNVDLYAININGHIVFADENINIFFTDNHIYRVEGLGENFGSIEIKKNNNNYTFFANNKRMSSAECENSELDPNENNVSYIYQTCFIEKINYRYFNKIAKNSNGNIIKIEYKIIPGRPSLTLSIK